MVVTMKSCMMGTLLGANCRKSMELERFICHGMIDLWLWIYGVYGVGVGWFMCSSRCKLQVKPFNWWLALLLLAVSGRGPAAWFITQFAATLCCSAQDSWTPALLIFSLFSEEDNILEHTLKHVRSSLTGKAFTGNILKHNKLHSKRQDGIK